MDVSRLEYIKNVNADSGWAYHGCNVEDDIKLNFKEGKDVHSHALKLPKGSLIILSQRPKKFEKFSVPNERYLTHVVELVNEGNEDKPEWTTETWGILRSAKVHWAADLDDHSRIPLDKEEMRVNWGWYNTKAKSLAGKSLMSQWNSIEALRTHLEAVFC